MRLGIDGKMNWLNLISYIEGDSGSNKGRMMVLYNLWMWELKAEDKVTEGRQREYFQLLNKKKNAKEQPEEPVFKFRLIAVNNTPANVATQLDALDTEHAISTTDEADEINAKWTGKECFCPVIHVFLDRFQNFSESGCNFIDRNNNLLTCTRESE